MSLHTRLTVFFCVFVILITQANDPDTLFNKARKLISTNPEKSTELIEAYEEYAEESNNTFKIGKSHFLKAEHAYITGNLLVSAIEYQKALEKFSELRNQEYIAITYSGIGSVFLAIHDFEKSNRFLEKALNIYESLNDSLGVAHMLFNKANIKTNTEDFDSAFYYYDLSQKYYINLGVQEEAARNMLMKSYLFFATGKMEQAKIECENSLKLSRSIQDLLATQSSLYTLGLIHHAKGNLDSSLDYLVQAEKMTASVNNLQVHADVLIQLSEVYRDMDSLEKAHEKLIEGSSLRDSINTPTRIHDIEHIYDQYLVSMDSEKGRSESFIERNWIYIVLSALLIISISLLYIFRRRKKLVFEKKNLTKELDQKNQELVSKTMKINQQQQMLQSIEDRLSEINNTEGKSGDLLGILSSLKTGYSEDLWKEFESHFTGVHKGFYKSLNEAEFNLTGNERRLAALICLNLNSKEISKITGKSTRSIDVARYRLRKKMNLNRNQSLVSALTDYL